MWVSLRGIKGDLPSQIIQSNWPSRINSVPESLRARKILYKPPEQNAVEKKVGNGVCFVFAEEAKQICGQGGVEGKNSSFGGKIVQGYFSNKQFEPITKVELAKGIPGFVREGGRMADVVL